MTINIFDIKEKSGNIFLIGRDDEDNSKVVISNKNDFYPHHGEFYIKIDSVSKLDEFENIIKTHIVPTTKKSLFGDELMKVRYNIINWDRVRDLRELIQKHRDVIFEGDLWPRTLYCLDSLPKLGYGVNGNWKICYLDIETTTSKGFPDSNNPQEEVLCSTFYDSYTKKYHFFYWGGEKLEDRDDIIIHQFETEEFMLEKIVRWLTKEQFDIVTGWNVDFDVSYLLQRYMKVCNKFSEGVMGLSPIGHYSYNEKYKQFSILGLCIFDLLSGYKRIVRNQMASFKLDNVAEEELGENKVEVDVKTLNKVSKEKLLSYNKKDVELCVRIDKKVNVINFFDGLRQFVGCPMDDVKYSRSIIDFMVLKKARDLNIVLPTANSQRIDKKDRRHFEGAYVNAVPGSYKNVIGFDIAGLYPNIIKTFNLSIECCREKTGEIFESGTVTLPEINIDMGKEGIIPSIVNDLMVLRKKYDDERDRWPAGTPEHEKNDILVESAKLVVDAIYGMCAFPGFRLFKSEIASTITYCGREIILHTKKFLEDMGHTNVIIDTDSNIFPCGKHTPDEIVKYGYEVLDKVNKEYDRWVKERWGIEKSYLVNVFKKVYDRLIVGAKKRYCGHVIWAKGHTSDTIEIVGLETKRCFGGDTIIPTKDGVKYIKDIKIGDRLYPDKRVKKLYKYGYNKELYKINVEGSRPFTCTPNHRFVVFDKQKKEKCLKQSCELNRDVDYFLEVMDTFQDKKETLSEDMCELLGYILSEGRVTIHEWKPGKFTIYLEMFFGDNEIEFVSNYVNLCQRVFKKKPVEYKSNIWGNQQTLSLGITKEFHLIKKYLIFHKIKTGMSTHSLKHRVPSELFNQPRKNIVKFLRSYCEGEGCVHDGGLVIGSPNKLLIYDVSLLLKLIGAGTSLTKSKANLKFECPNPSYRIDVCKRYKDIISTILISTRKKQLCSDLTYNEKHDKRNVILDGHRLKKIKSIEIQNPNLTIVYDIEVEGDHIYSFGNFLSTHNSDYSRFARDFQFDLMKLLLNDEKDAVVMDFIKGKFKEIKTVPPSLIAIPTKIEKNLNDYATNLPKVRGAKYSSRILNEPFEKGDKPLLLFCEGDSDVILFYNEEQAEKLLQRVKIDWEKMIERNILMTSHMLIESDRGSRMNTSLELISKNQTTLFGF